MNKEESFCNSTYEDQTHMAERELSAFISAVTELFGPEQAKISTEDWLDESYPPRSTSRDWRAVTVAASARLANRLPSHCLVGRSSRRLIRKYRQYHRPIVSNPRFWSDALIASRCNRKSAAKKGEFTMTLETVR